MEKPILTQKPESSNRLIGLIEYCIFSARWILVPIYLGLCVSLSAYLWQFLIELVQMIHQTGSSSTEVAMLSLLGLVDTAMIANLVIMVSVGSFSIFIKEIDPKKFKNKPRFMNHITAAGLKTKMGSSLIGVSSIHLLKKFIEAASTEGGDHAVHLNWYSLSMVLTIHVVFVVSTIALALIDKDHGLPPKPASNTHDE